MPIRAQEWIASLIAAGGLLWGIHAATRSFTSFDNLQLSRDAGYTTLLGIVIWLHAKWRRSLDMRKV